VVAQIVTLLELGKSVAEVAQDMEVSKDLVYARIRTPAFGPEGGERG
jgi:hypothetical protein